jgi:hypothetical protein
MISDKDLQEKINSVCASYVGQLDELYEAVGMVMVGRLYGWRVMRLATSQRVWAHVKLLFGDPKDLMPERGVFSHKSVGLNACDKIGEYWAVVKRHVEIPAGSKKEVA